MATLALKIKDQDGDNALFDNFVNVEEGIVCSVAVKAAGDYHYVFIEQDSIDDVIEFLCVRRAEYHRLLNAKEGPTLSRLGGQVHLGPARHLNNS